MDIKTVFDVAAKLGKITGGNGSAWIDYCGAAAGEFEGLEGKASFESCETQNRYARSTRQRSVEAPTLWMKSGEVHILERGGKMEGSWVSALVAAYWR